MWFKISFVSFFFLFCLGTSWLFPNISEGRYRENYRKLLICKQNEIFLSMWLNWLLIFHIPTLCRYLIIYSFINYFSCISLLICIFLSLSLSLENSHSNWSVHHNSPPWHIIISRLFLSLYIYFSSSLPSFYIVFLSLSYLHLSIIALYFLFLSHRILWNKCTLFTMWQPLTVKCVGRIKYGEYTRAYIVASHHIISSGRVLL